MQLRIATWNVNSIRSRLEHLLHYLQNEVPEILLLQETKCENSQFPAESLEDLGYNLAFHGQKSYNGVAILSRLPLEDIVTALPNESGEQARYIEAVVSLPQNQSLRVASVYVPNGQEVGSEKFTYKLSFLNNLFQHAKELLTEQSLLVMGGDYNVSPYAMDVYDAAKLDGTVCYHHSERERLRAIMNLGLYDAFRSLHPTTQEFSWWDYRANSFERNHGLRIDHLLLSAKALDVTQHCVMQKSERARDKPSDHIPVMCTLNF
ncbi:MAG: exodeoxyribonuclease III [Rickettsiales bacterium]|nr:exodeoxyribonuclease III [Rickettsiales bacterium]